MPVNWNPTFDSQDKIPLGTYILREELPQLFPDNEIKNIGYNEFDFLQEMHENDEFESTFMFLYPQINYDKNIIHDLLNFTNHQNVVFISAFEIGELASDSIQTHRHFDSVSISIKDEVKATQKNTLTLFNATGTYDTISLKGSISRQYFTKIPDSAYILGEIIIDGKPEPNFIQIPYKSGWLFLHLEPLVFTNYAMLQKEKNDYVAKVFSLLPDQQIYWNNHRILQRKSQRKSDGSSWVFLRYVWGQKMLKYSLLCLLFAAFCYMAFNSSRRQKTLTYIKPYTHSYLAFIQNLAPIFKKTENYKALCMFKINYFKELVKDHYYITSFQEDEKFLKHFQQKSQLTYTETQTLLKTILKIQKKGFCEFKDFQELTELLNHFYQKSTIYGNQ